MNVFVTIQATNYFDQFSSIDFQSIESHCEWNLSSWLENSQSLTSDDETISAFDVLKVTKQ